MYYDIDVTQDKIYFVTNATTNLPIRFLYIQKYENRVSSVLRRVRKKPK